MYSYKVVLINLTRERDSYNFELDFLLVHLVSSIPMYPNNRERDKRASTTVNYSDYQAK